MKRTTSFAHLATLAAAFLAATPFITKAQTWTTHFAASGSARTVLVDPFSAVPSQPSLFVGGVGAEGPSILQVDPAGIALNPDNDPGNSNQLGYDAYSGCLYSVGSSGSAWVVRESHDGGLSWTTADAYQINGQPAWASGFASDGQGNVLVSGRAYDSSGYSHWIVRRRNGNGVWSTVRDWSERRKDYAASKMHIANGYLFVVGRCADRWVVQRGSNLGAASILWDAAYAWAPKGTTAGAVAVASDADGAVYVLGVTGGSEIVPRQCVLQKSANAGQSWQTVATFAESTVSNGAFDLAFDSSRNLYLVGYAAVGPSSGLVNKWIVHRRAFTTQAWQAWFPFGDAQSLDDRSEARAVTTDAMGNVFVAGAVRDQGGWYSVVQRFAP